MPFLNKRREFYLSIPQSDSSDSLGLELFTSLMARASLRKTLGRCCPPVSINDKHEACDNLFVFIFPAGEDASHALKTLHSSKAPLVKKRQVMRAMAGDYRKKMEEEKSKQFKLIQNGGR